MKLYLLYLLIFYILLNFLVNSEVYYASPDPDAIDFPNSCTNISSKCKLSALLDKVENSSFTIILTKGNTLYSGEVKRTKSCDNLILNAEQGASFNSNFFIYFHENIKQIEMHNFIFENGIEPHPSYNNRHFILHLNATSETKLIVNNLEIKNLNSNSIFEVHGNSNLIIDFNELKISNLESNSINLIDEIINENNAEINNENIFQYRYENNKANLYKEIYEESQHEQNRFNFFKLPMREFLIENFENDEIEFFKGSPNNFYESQRIIPQNLFSNIFEESQNLNPMISSNDSTATISINLTNCNIEGIKTLFSDKFKISTLKIDKSNFTNFDILIKLSNYNNNEIPTKIILMDSIIQNGATFLNNNLQIIELIQIHNSKVFNINKLIYSNIYQNENLNISITDSKIVTYQTILYIYDTFEKSREIKLVLKNSEFLTESNLIDSIDIYCKLQLSLSIDISDCILNSTTIKTKSEKLYFNIQNSIIQNCTRDPVFLLEANIGESNVTYNTFQYLSRGFIITYLRDPHINQSSSVLVKDNYFLNFKYIYTFNETNLLRRVGGSAFILSNIISVYNNIFENCEYLSEYIDEILYLRSGVLGLYSIVDLVFNMKNNTFNNTISNVGGTVVIISNTYLPSTINVIDNVFEHSYAYLGSGFALMNLQLIDNLNLINNHFLNHHGDIRSDILIQSLIKSSNIVIYNNTFENLLFKEFSSVIDFQSGSIELVNISFNSFINVNVVNEIQTNVQKFTGIISDLDINIQSSKRTELINLLSERVENLNIKNIVFRNDKKNFLRIATKIRCKNILIDNIITKEYVEGSFPIFSFFQCLDIENIKFTNIITAGRFDINQNSLLESTILLSNVTLIKAKHYDSNSPLLNFKNISPIIRDSNFVGETISNETTIPILIAEYSNVSIYNSYFDSGKNDLGGCISVSFGNELKIINSILNNCIAKSFGGAIYTSEIEKIIIINTNITNSKSLNHGGGLVYKGSYSNIILDKVIFQNNQANSEGGCLFLQPLLNVDLKLIDSKFINCKSNLGGGVLFDGMIILNLEEKILFENCSASFGGGAIWTSIYLDSLNKSKSNIDFINCKGDFSNTIGSAPNQFDIHERSETSIGYPLFFNWDFNSKYLIVALRSEYGIMYISNGEGLTLKKLNDGIPKGPNCNNEIGDLSKQYYCITYDFKPTLLNEVNKYQLTYVHNIRNIETKITQNLTLESKGLWLLIIILLVIAFNILIIFIISAFVFCGIPSIVAFANSKRQKFANLELSLLRKRFDQDRLIDGDEDIMTSVSHVFQIKLDDVEIKEKIGSGGSGAHVMRGKWKDEDIALKLFRGAIIENMREEFENEINLLSSLYHSNIVKFTGIIIEPPRYGIATEYCPGSVSKLIKSGKSKELTISNKINILLQTTSAMEYLVKRNIIHRDLKWENVLMNEFGEVKLTDLGLSRRINEAAPKNLTARVGTSYLMAPEVVKGNEYDWKCDVFSFGIMIYELLNDKLDPFEGQIGVEFRIANDPDLRPNINQLNLNSNDQWILEVMISCWSHNTIDRPSFTKLKEIFQSKINIANLNQIKFSEDDIKISKPL